MERQFSACLCDVRAVGQADGLGQAGWGVAVIDETLLHIIQGVCSSDLLKKPSWLSYTPFY